MIELPASLSDQFALWLAMGKKGLTIALLRYLLIATPAFLLCYLLLGRALRPRWIQQQSPSTSQIGRELTLSLSSSAIFACIDVIVIVLSLQGIMRVRVLSAAPALPELAGSVGLLLLFHDAYFYWAHRLMHWGPLYRLAHVTHHRSISPTPFAAFAFHPIEAVIHYGYVPLVAYFTPIHVAPLFVFGIVMTALNVYGHLGIELLPRGFARHPLGRFFLTPTHHDLHHSTVDHNYGFYFSMWDRLMGTNHPSYADAFDQAASGIRGVGAARLV